MEVEEAFKILGLLETASLEEVRRSYRRLASTCHPDMGGDARKFHELTQAYHAAQQRLQDLGRVGRLGPTCQRCGGTKRIIAMRGFQAIRLECPDCKE